MRISTFAMYENARSARASIFCTKFRAIMLYEATDNISRDTSIERVIRATEDIESIRHIRYFLAYE